MGSNRQLNRPVQLKPLDLSELDGADQLLQTGFWGRFKQASGWFPRAFTWSLTGTDDDRDGNGSAGEDGGCDDAVSHSGKNRSSGGFSGRFLVLERRFPGGLKMAYIPYGPELPGSVFGDGPRASGDVSALLAQLARSLKRELSPGCFVLRYDLCGGRSGTVGTDIPAAPELSSPLRKAPYRVQPPDTVILSLVDQTDSGLDDQTLLAGMHKKTRYNIRLSGRKGVVIRRFTGSEARDHLSHWYRLYQETGSRDGITIHPESYYRRLFESEGPVDPDTERGRDAAVEPGFSLYMAYHDGNALAGIIVSRSGARSVYMYGASSSEKRELMPNHLLQWTAISDARTEGAREYDFFGVPPADDPGHPMHGLWRFKTGFGGELHHYLGAWDYVYSPFLYSLYAAAENLRGRLAALRKRS